MHLPRSALALGLPRGVALAMFKHSYSGKPIMGKVTDTCALGVRAMKWAVRLIREGKTRLLIADAWTRLFKALAAGYYTVAYRWTGRLSGPPDVAVRLQTDHPVAYESPDHLIPFGTSQNNSTNKYFVMAMRRRILREFSAVRPALLDLGCSGGQLVRDFLDLGYLGVGLEGSDYSLKAKRANWPMLAGKHLFTCDVAHPFQLTVNDQPVQFHLITMWEVLEHIETARLPQLFDNIIKHLAPGGYFVASTTSGPDMHDGVDLHQTKWPNAEWRAFLSKEKPQLEWVDLGLTYYQMVRHNEERSFLTYRRKA